MQTRFSLKTAFLFLLCLSALARAASKATDANQVSVTVDGVTYQCTGGTSSAGDLLISGSYKNLAGNDLCPQSVRANVSGGTMSSVEVTFLSPCSGGSSRMTCSGAQCTGDGNTLTVIGRDLYYFLNVNGLGARFQLQ